MSVALYWIEQAESHVLRPRPTHQIKNALCPDDASGGGLSDQPQPSFQAGLVIHNGNTIISSNGKRAYPDVAFDGDYVNSPVLIVNQGFVQEVAGTSLVAPAWAALLAWRRAQWRQGQATERQRK